MRRFTTAVALLLGLGAVGHAQTVSYTETAGVGYGIAGSNTSGTGTCTAAGFNTSLGTLLRVDVDYSVNYMIAGSADSWYGPWLGSATSTSTMSATYGSHGGFSDSYEADQLMGGDAFEIVPFGAYNATQTKVTNTSSKDNIFRRHSDFVNFAVGTSTTFSVAFNNTQSNDCPIFFSNWSTSVTFTIKYTYLPVGQTSYNVNKYVWTAGGPFPLNTNMTASVTPPAFNTALGTLTQVDVEMVLWTNITGTVTSIVSPWAGSLSTQSSATASFGDAPETMLTSLPFNNVLSGSAAGTVGFGNEAFTPIGTINSYTAGGFFDGAATGVARAIAVTISNTSASLGDIDSFTGSFKSKASIITTYYYTPAP